MKRRALCLVFLLSCCGWALGQAKPAPEAPSLYKRLGGYDAIAAVTDDFIVRAMADAQLNRFLLGLSETSKARLRQLIVDKICADTGGPCLYTGRDMKTAHKGLAITGADWDLAVKHLVASVDKFKVPEKEKGEFLGAVAAMKGEIVEKP